VIRDSNCPHGHDRATFERFYRRKGAPPIRRCRACQTDRERNSRQLARLAAEKAHAEIPRPPTELLWADFCRTIVDRIEAVRRDEAMRERIERRRAS